MSLKSSQDRTLKKATVVNVFSGYVDVEVGGGSSLLRGIPVVGGTDNMNAGDDVLLGEFGGEIYALSLGARTGTREVVIGASGGSGSMSPHAMSYHLNEVSWHAALTGSQLHEPKEHTHNFVDVSGDLDGDTIVIDWSPTNSTPDVSPTQVTQSYHLTAILAGLDNAVTGSASDITNLSSEPYIVASASSNLSSERVLQNSDTIQVTDNTTNVQLNLILSSTWSGLKTTAGLAIDRSLDFVWGGQHSFMKATRFVGEDSDIWFDPIRCALYVNSGTFPDVRPAYDAALTVQPAYKSQSGLVVKRPWPADEYTGNIFRIMDENNHDLLLLTGSGNLESGNPRFVSGSKGWQITHDGAAEFSNITARGELKSTAMVYEEQHVQGGTMLVLGGTVLVHELNTVRDTSSTGAVIASARITT
jgi:hypothetical protein